MASPVIGLDHVAVLTADLDRAVADYRLLLGRAPAVRMRGDGAASALFVLDNMAIELMAPDGDGDGDGEGAARIHAALAAQGEGIASLCFRVDDAERMQRRLQRLGLEPEPVRETTRIDELTGRSLTWRRTRATTAASHGVRLFFLDRAEPLPPSAAIADHAVGGLDHVVVTTAQPERAAALYGARLGLDMRLDLTRPDWGARLMFFRCGDLIVEIAHRLGAAAAPAHDGIMGLSYRVADAAAAQARLQAAGVAVSEVRKGRKPGTKIFTVKDHTAGVATLMIEGASPAGG
jgi:catechol 2,3-dioxygenase-like lactoylglutathione lyase family enzyme